MTYCTIGTDRKMHIIYTRKKNPEYVSTNYENSHFKSVKEKKRQNSTGTKAVTPKADWELYQK